MEKLDRLCDAILLYARGNDPLGKPMPRVSFNFQHDGSDLPELPDSWTLTVTLTGVDRIEDGKPVIAYEKKWEGKGSKAEDAFRVLFKTFQADIEGRKHTLHAETIAVDQAITALRADVDLSELWSKNDPDEPMRAMAEEAAKTL